MSGGEGGYYVRELSVKDGYGSGFFRGGGSWEANFLRGLLKRCVVESRSDRVKE
jgi:hypothetical protein